MIDFEGELRYLTTMCMVRMMCRSGLLTEKERREARRLLGITEDGEDAR